jgi:hypothetical protein
MSATSPKFNETIDVLLILIKTDYNASAITNKKNMQLMQSSMASLNDILEPNTCVNPKKGCKITFTKLKSITKKNNQYKIPNMSNIKFLYAFDEDEMHYNDSQTERIDKIRHSLKLHKINDNGCFVFEINTKNDITFSDILRSLVYDMTQMEFCVGFDISGLYDVMYYKKHKAIIFKFETEGG